MVEESDTEVEESSIDMPFHDTRKSSQASHPAAEPIVSPIDGELPVSDYTIILIQKYLHQKWKDTIPLCRPGSVGEIQLELAGRRERPEKFPNSSTLPSIPVFD